MTAEPQTITTPEGTEMVLIERARYDALLAAEEDLADLVAAQEGAASLAADGGLPLEVERNIAAGIYPLPAWRKYRGMSQTELAEAAGLSQPAIVRLEHASPGSGRRETLVALAKALDAPLWSLAVPVPSEKGPARTKALLDRANPPEKRILRKS